MSESQIVKKLFSGGNPFKILMDIKSHDYISSYKKINQAVKHPFVKSLLNKATLPKDINGLNNSKRLPNSGNLEGELAWLLNSIVRYSKEINTFVQLENDFQRAVLLEEYDLAESIIEKIENEICVSFWSIENRFTLKQRKNGTEENWLLLNEINIKTKSPLTLLLSHFFSKKAENDITILQYKRDLESLLNNLSSEDAEYILFKLGYLYPNHYSHYSSILNFESPSTVIDKYLLVIEVLTEMLVYGKFNKVLLYVLNDLSENNIIDKRITRLIELTSANYAVVDDFNEDILNYFELYSVGNYNECLELSSDLLKKYPECIEIYEIHIKCLLELKLEFVPTNVSLTIDEIIRNLISIYDKKSDFYSSRENLLKHYLSFSKLNFFKQLYSLTSSLTNSENREVVQFIYFVYSSYSNPQIILLNDFKNRISFESKKYEKYLALQINTLITKDKANLLDNKKIPDHKIEIYKARADFYNKKNVSIEKLLEFKKDDACNNYLLEEIIIFLYSGYLVENKIHSVLSLIVDTYFENKFMIERLNKTIILDYIFENNYELEETNIDLPLFFYLQNVDSYFLYAALEQYLLTLSVDRPSQMKFDEYDKKIIFLLSKVCSIDVLNNFYLIYESDEEVIEERIKILKKLTSVDISNSSQYIEEIASLTQRQKINKTIKSVNDGKISLNFSRIKEDREYNLENSFNRFIKFKSFSDKNELNVLDVSELLVLYLYELNSDSSKLQNASFILFKSLYIEVVEHFLFSKEHGLDGDLSTRIRHGVLENQLRPVFSSNNLISSKGIDDSYNDIFYWKNLCNERFLNAEITEKIQKNLKEFSKNVDEAIAKIVSDFIQIQSNRHTTKQFGLFNYRFTDEFLWLLYKGALDEVHNYDDFLNFTFEVLKSHTENLLKHITEYFQTEFNSVFQELLDSLQENLKLILSQSGDVWIEINQNINRVKTQIEYELYEVSKWFKINNSSNNTILDIDTIIHTAVEIININNVNKIIPNIDINVDSYFERGVFYIDIFKILIENSIKHSNLEIDDLVLDILVKNEILYNEEKMIEEPFSKLTIQTTNNLAKDTNVEIIKKMLSSIVNCWNSDLSSVNKEGGSGFQKIERILRYDIKVLNSDFNFSIEDNKVTIKLDVVNKYRILDEE